MLAIIIVKLAFSSRWLCNIVVF